MTAYRLQSGTSCTGYQFVNGSSSRRVFSRSDELVVVVEAPEFFRDFGECTVASRAQRRRHKRNVNKRLRTTVKVADCWSLLHEVLFF